MMGAAEQMILLLPAIHDNLDKNCLFRQVIEVEKFKSVPSGRFY
jgi:hypothetical protein